MNNIKVVQVIHGIDKNSGGASTYMKLLSEELAQEIQVRIGTLDSKNNLKISNEVPCFYAKGNLGGFGYSRELSSFLKSCKADIFHGNGLWQYPVHSMSKIAKKCKIPFILSPHGMLEPWSLEQNKLQKKILYQLFQQKDLQEASVIHATAPMEAKNIREKGFKNPIAVIPNGINLREFPKKDLKNSKKKRTLLFLSRIHPKKGIEMLIQAWSDTDRSLRGEWVLKIAGNGEESYIKSLQDLISAQGLTNEIKLVGPKFGKEKINTYHEADLFILPTYSENFGIVVVEALSCGVPVITTHGAPWEDLELNNCGWWIPANVNSLQMTLEKALKTTPDELERMGINGRKLVENKYSISAVANQMIELYEWVLGKAPKPSFIHVP